MKRMEALMTLGVRSDADPDTIRKAYGDAVRHSHPDQGGTGSDGSFKKLKQARDLLLSGGDETAAAPCKMCRGKGYVFVEWRKVPCARGCKRD